NTGMVDQNYAFSINSSHFGHPTSDSLSSSGLPSPVFPLFWLLFVLCSPFLILDTCYSILLHRDRHRSFSETPLICITNRAGFGIKMTLTSCLSNCSDSTGTPSSPFTS